MPRQGKGYRRKIMLNRRSGSHSAVWKGRGRERRLLAGRKERNHPEEEGGLNWAVAFLSMTHHEIRVAFCVDRRVLGGGKSNTQKKQTTTALRLEEKGGVTPSRKTKIPIKRTPTLMRERRGGKKGVVRDENQREKLTSQRVTPRENKELVLRRGRPISCSSKHKNRSGN